MKSSENEQLINELYEQFSEQLYRYALLRTGNKEEAKDIIQDTYYKAYRGLHSFNGLAQYKTWLYSITRNTINDYLRKKKRVDLLKFRVVTGETPDYLLPDELLNLKEDTKVLYLALSRLKKNHQEVIILRKIKEFSTRETSEILGCSEAKVKSNLVRGLQALKAEISKEGIGYEFKESEQAF
ncbi:RNA polymerase sigma factor [Bacillus sp. AK128]